MSRSRKALLLLLLFSPFAFGQINNGGGSASSIAAPSTSASSNQAYNNTTYGIPFLFQVGNGGNVCSNATDWTLDGQTGVSTDGFSICNLVPSSAVAIQSNGISAEVRSNSTTTNAVGVFPLALCGATGCNIWGDNPQTDDLGHAATQMYGTEVDTNVRNASTVGQAIRINGGFLAQPALDFNSFGNFAGVVLFKPTAQGGTGTWSGGYACAAGATNNGKVGNCFDAGPAATSGASNSQAIVFHLRTSGASILSTGFLSAPDTNSLPSILVLPNMGATPNGAYMALLPVHGASSQTSPNNMLSAGHATLAAGTVSVTFTEAYATAPECVANGHTTANAMLVSSSTTAVTVTSSSGADTQVVSWFCSPAAN